MSPANILIIGAPLGMGGCHPGTAHGPAAARAAGIVESLREGNHDAVTEDSGDEFIQDLPMHDRLQVVATCCAKLRAKTRATVIAGTMPVVIGGDHSIAVGSMSGVAAARRAMGEDPPGLLWIDAHTDINTHETTPSGNPHGMSAAALIGLDVRLLSDVVGEDGLFDPARIVFVGARDIDIGEQEHLDAHDITVFSTQDICEQGPEAVMHEALKIVAPDGVPFAISFDVDVIDPAVAPGVDTPVPDGLSPDQTMELLAIAGAHAPILAFDLVELNPEKDVDGHTARIAVACVQVATDAARQLARG